MADERDPWSVDAAAPANEQLDWGKYKDAPTPGRAPDKYEQAAIDERARLKAHGVEPATGYGARLKYGVGMGWTDDLMAGLSVPLEMAKRGEINPVEAYRYTRARERLLEDETRQNTAGPLGAAIEVTGGLVGAGGLVGGTRATAKTIPFTNRVIPESVVNVGKNTLQGAEVGAIAGAGGAHSVEDMPGHAAVGAAIGGGLGATLPFAVSGLGWAGGKAADVLQLPRLRNPENVATEALAEKLRRTGMTPEDLVAGVEGGRAAGQPFTVADTLGNEGGRALAGLGKTPGEQRDIIAEFMRTRDANLPQLAGAQVGRSFGAPTTAQAAREALIERASREARPLYEEAMQVPTWSPRLQEFLDADIAKQGLRHGVYLQKTRNVGTGRPFNPEDAAITGFNEAGDPIISGVPNMQTLHTLKVGIDDIIERNYVPETGKFTAEGEAAIGFKNRMLAQIDALNPKYAEARRVFGGPMEVAEAIRAGQQMATRGRAADNTRLFESMPPTTQQGVRIGWADRVQEQLERTGNIPTALKPKSIKGQAEIEAMAPYGPNSLKDYLERVATMQQTSKAAIGGPQTAENLADIAETPGGANALGLIKNMATGNTPGMLRDAFETLKAAARGESEAQRVAITKALLERDPAKVREMAERIADYEARRRGVNPFVPDLPPRYREPERRPPRVRIDTTYWR